jgi:hypothetical protein
VRKGKRKGQAVKNLGAAERRRNEISPHSAFDRKLLRSGSRNQPDGEETE